jgi:uncharacterized membrane protein
MNALGGALGALALAWFALCWLGYQLYANYWRRDRSLMGATASHRVRWMEQMAARDVRILDSTLLQTQAQSVSFFASTSILILGGLVALLGARDEAQAMVSGVPFAEKTDALGWEIRIGLLVVIFVYAFFKFTWSMRQYNYVALLIGATPPAGHPDCAKSADRAARMSHLAVDHFNEGIRAYYFGLAAIGWFIHPWVFAAATTWVVLVLWRREFHSRTLAALRD